MQIKYMKLSINWKAIVFIQIVCGCFFYFNTSSELFWLFVLISIISDTYYTIMLNKLRDEKANKHS